MNLKKGKTIKAIFFDLGNVIIKFDPKVLVKGYAPYSKLKELNLTDYVLDSDNINRYMEGKLSSSQFYTKTKKIFKLDMKYGDFFDVWNSIFFSYPEMEKILKKIKKNNPEIKLVLISNTNEAHYEYLEKEYGILKVFDKQILSHEVGLQKPHPGIFKEALDYAGCLPKDVFYTDDRLDLIEAARVMGIRAYQFTGHEEFLARVSKFNIKV